MVLDNNENDTKINVDGEDSPLLSQNTQNALDAAKSVLPGKEAVESGVHKVGAALSSLSAKLGGHYAIRTLGVFGSICTIVLCVFSCLGDVLLPWNLVIDIYISFFCLCLLTLELAESFAFLRKFRLKVEFWARLLTRAWGKAFIYLLIGVSALAKFSLFWLIDGGSMIVIGLMHCAYSYRTTKIIEKIRDKARLQFHDDWDNTLQKFDENQDGVLSHEEIEELIKTLDVPVDINEVHVITNFLDRDRDGKVSIKEFKDWLIDNKVDGIYL